MRISDWSSDVCSSDLRDGRLHPAESAANTSAGALCRSPAYRCAASKIVAPLLPSGCAHLSKRCRCRPLGCVSAEASGVRKSVVSGKRVSVRVDLGGRSIIKQQTAILLFLNTLLYTLC